jgi:hypothetical protein
MVDQLGERNVRFASQNEVREYNLDSVPFHLYPVNPPQAQTQSTIAPANPLPAKGRCHCLSSLWAGVKKIFFGIYDILGKWIFCLPKRKEPIPNGTGSK